MCTSPTLPGLGYGDVLKNTFDLFERDFIVNLLHQQHLEVNPAVSSRHAVARIPPNPGTRAAWAITTALWGQSQTASH